LNERSLFETESTTVEILFQVLMLLVAVFLILLVLVQRGRGGGLTGALGGMGGQSAFGTKAGDLFTKITIGAAIVWILLACFVVKWYGSGTNFDPSLGAQAPLANPSGEVSGPAEKPGEKSAEKSADEPAK
jgi:preprotein translocase subunit SecG